MTRRKLGALLLVPALCAPLFLVALGSAGLSDPDEGRNAEVAREMLASGDWVTPHINDARYLDKPPVFFWVAALSFRLFGVNERAARLPSALSAIGALVLVVWFARRHFGDGTARLAGLILAVSPLYLVFGRLVIFDMMLLLCTTTSLVALYEALEIEGHALRGSIVMFAAAGVGTITKGPVALVVPLLVAVVWALLRRQPSLLARLHWGKGLLVYLAIVAPWLILVEVRNPGFFRYAVLGENLARMTSNPYDTARPFHFYFKFILPGLFPWILLCSTQGVRLLLRRGRTEAGAPSAGAAQASADAGRHAEARAARFVGVWLAVLYLFFSLIASKRPSYILPCAVPVAILAARLIGRACAAGASKSERDDLSIGAMIAAGACLVGAIVALVAGPAMRLTAMGETRHLSPLQLAGIFRLTAAALALSGVAIFLLRRTRRPLLFVAVATLPFLSFLPLARTASRQIEEARSSRPLSRFLIERLRPEDRVICFEEFRPGLNFYLKRPIYQVTRAGRVFTSNYVATHLDQFRTDPGFRLLTQDAMREALAAGSGGASTTYILADRKEYGPLFEAARIPLKPVWEAGGFGLFVPAAADDAAPSETRTHS
jgi:4-amino-4-deoxy-L-arabinose transferase-like glycosyltransferase